jgi:site-specific recombinase XerD
MAWSSAKHQPNTQRQYQYWLKKFCEYIGDKNVKDVEVDDFIGYYHLLKVQGYAESSIAYFMVALRVFWHFMCMTNQTSVPYDLINVPKRFSVSHTPSTREDIVRLLKALDDEPDGFKKRRDMLIVLFLFSSGVRVSELSDLKMSELQLADRYAVIASKKNRKLRRIFWDETTEVYMLLYIEERMAVAKSDFLFVNCDRDVSVRGGRLHPRSVERTIERLKMKAGITKKLTPHSIRHGFGKDAVEQGENLKMLQEWLGHKHITGTETYMQMSDPSLVEGYKGFADKRVIDLSI